MRFNMRVMGMSRWAAELEALDAPVSSNFRYIGYFLGGLALMVIGATFVALFAKPVDVSTDTTGGYYVGTLGQRLFASTVFGFLPILTGMAYLRLSVKVDDAGIGVRNKISSIDIPWACVTDIVARGGCLVVMTREQVVRVASVQISNWERGNSGKASRAERVAIQLLRLKAAAASPASEERAVRSSRGVVRALAMVGIAWLLYASGLIIAYR